MPVPKPPANLGPCFSCGEMGHLRRFCPKSAPGATRWYPETESNAKGSVNYVKVSNVRVPVNQWAYVSKGVDVLADKGQGDVKVGVNWPKDDAHVKASESGEKRLGVNGALAAEGSEQLQREIEYVKTKEEVDECEGYSDVVQDGGVDVTEHCGLPNQDWEYEAEDEPVCVKGKLAKCVTFWKEVILAPSYVLDILQSGYVMPFCNEPPQYYRANQRSALVNSSFVSSAIDELLADGRVQSIEGQPQKNPFVREKLHS